MIDGTNCEKSKTCPGTKYPGPTHLRYFFFGPHAPRGHSVLGPTHPQHKRVRSTCGIWLRPVVYIGAWGPAYCVCTTGGCNLVPEPVPLFSLGPHKRQWKIRARVLVGPRFGISSLYILYYNFFGVQVVYELGSRKLELCIPKSRLHLQKEGFGSCSAAD
jgi:hypothetical protein